MLGALALAPGSAAKGNANGYWEWGQAAEAPADHGDTSECLEQQPGITAPMFDQKAALPQRCSALTSKSLAHKSGSNSCIKQEGMINQPGTSRPESNLGAEIAG